MKGLMVPSTSRAWDECSGSDTVTKDRQNNIISIKDIINNQPPTIIIISYGLFEIPLLRQRMYHAHYLVLGFSFSNPTIPPEAHASRSHDPLIKV